ncbi:MAG: hypothetical protein FJW40_16810 [Acidobacteria bacterium]|nr:hypothetical protein [Acidobacteriota bacterium]
MRAPLPMLAVVFATGCGYVGEPLPPALHLPQPVADLEAVQRGAKIVVRFTPPRATTEGLPLKAPPTGDLRIGTRPEGEFDTTAWAAAAEPVPVTIAEGETTEVRVDAARWAGREILAGIRFANPKGKSAGFSNLVAVQVVEPLNPPPAPAAQAVAEGIRISWKAPDPRPQLRYRVYKLAPGAEEPILAGETDALAYTDRETEYGKRYTYEIQAVVKPGEREVESEHSTAVSLVPVDRFAPAVPKGLLAQAGVDSIELVWDRVTAPDLAGYRVYRGTPGTAPVRIGQSQSPSFGDRAVRAGQSYQYHVTAYDLAGNESEASGTVTITAPQ